MALHVNDRFERTTVRFMFPNEFYQPIADRNQTGRGTQRAGVVDRPEINGARFAIVCIDNRDTGVAQRSVDGEHAHY